MQNQFYQRFASPQVHGNFDSSIDQGSWQMPQSQSVQQQAPEDTYFTGNAANSSHYYTNKQSAVGGGSEEVFTTGISNYNNRSFGGNKRLQNTYTAMGNQTNYKSEPYRAGSNSQYVSNQDQDRYGKMTHISLDDDGGGYYGFPDESYMTNLGGSKMSVNSSCIRGMSVNMGGFDGSNVNMVDSSSNLSNNENSFDVENSLSTMPMNGSRMIMDRSLKTGTYSDGAPASGKGNGFNRASNFSKSMIGDYNLGSGMRPRNVGGNMRMSRVGNNIGRYNSINPRLKNQIKTAPVATGTSASWNYKNNYKFNSATGNYFNGRGRQGRGFGFNNYKSANMSHDAPLMMGGQHYSSGGNDVYLNVANYNQWCFLRKSFNKQDNDLAEHLFEIHEKFCHCCLERIEEKKLGKKRKHSVDLKETERPPEQELNEEELEVKNLMGFAGFKTTKGVRVKDNNYSIVKSVSKSQPSNKAVGTTSLTEAEKRMINLRGGFSVFNNKHDDLTASACLKFGAPAVTFYTYGDNGPGFSNKLRFTKKAESTLEKDIPE